jgi:peroxiredoxin
MKMLLRIALLVFVPVFGALAAEAPAAKFGSLIAGTVAPDFSATTADGKTLKLSDFKGRTVILNFWATNRGPATALESFPVEHAAAGVVVIGICAGASRDEFSQAVKKSHGSVSYLLAWDPAGKNAGDASIAKKFGIGSFPATGVIDPAGKVVGGFTGFGAQSGTVLRDYLRAAGVVVSAPAEEKNPVMSPPETKAVALSAGTAAPEFTAVDGDGRNVKLSDFAGKIVVLDFWATWCQPAIAALPQLQRIAAAAKSQGVVLLAACTSDSRGEFEKWTKENAAKFPDAVFANDPIGRNTPGKYAERVSVKLYGVARLPTVFLVGRDGKIVEVLVGDGEDDDRLEVALKKLGIVL